MTAPIPARATMRGAAMAALAMADADHCEVGRWASRAVARWVQAGGALTLHECLGLPDRPHDLARSQRDRGAGDSGRLEPARATEELLRNSDPARLRARVLKAATRTHADLAAEVQKLERQVAELRAALADCERIWRARSAVVVHVDDLAQLLADAQGRLVAALGTLIRHDRPRIELALRSGAIERLVDRLLAKAVWQPMVPPQWSDEVCDGVAP